MNFKKSNTLSIILGDIEKCLNYIFKNNKFDKDKIPNNFHKIDGELINPLDYALTNLVIKMIKNEEIKFNSKTKKLFNDIIPFENFEIYDFHIYKNNDISCDVSIFLLGMFSMKSINIKL